MAKASRTDEEEWKAMFSQTILPSIDVASRVMIAAQEEELKRSLIGRKGSRKLVVMCCSVIAFIMALGVMLVFPASAEQIRKIPVVGKIFEGDIFSFAGDSGVMSGKTLGLSAKIKEAVTDNGVTIRIEDVLYDGTRLSLGFILKSEQANYMFLEDIELKVDGESRHGGVETKPRQINKYEAAGVMNIDLKEHMDSFMVSLRIGQVSGVGDGNEMQRLRGDWSFELPIVNSAVQSTVQRTFTTDNVVQAGKARFEVTGITITPITTKIDFRYKGSTEWLGFQLMDEKGMLVEYLGSTFDEDDAGETSGTITFAPVNERSRLLQVTPYHLQVTRNKEDQKVKAMLTEAFPIELSQGGIGEISVSDVEFLADKTLIYYEVKGKNPYIQFASLWLETAAGEMIISDNGKRTRVSEASYSYVLEYPALDSGEPYVIGTMKQTDIDLQHQLTINLKLE